ALARPPAQAGAVPVAWALMSKTAGVLSVTVERAVADKWSAQSTLSDFPVAPLFLYRPPAQPDAEPVATGVFQDGEMIGFVGLGEEDRLPEDQRERRPLYTRPPAQAGAVTEAQGCRLVPEEPTDAMYAAAEREWDGRMSARIAGVWKAMLA